MHDPVQLSQSEDILGQEIILDEAPVLGLISTDNRVIAVMQHLWPLCRFPVAHIQRALGGDHRLRYSEGNHAIDLALTTPVKLVIGMLGDEVVAKEMGHASLGVGDERFLLGEFELECVVQELPDVSLNLLGFDAWPAETERDSRRLMPTAGLCRLGRPAPEGQPGRSRHNPASFVWWTIIVTLAAS